MKTTYFSSQALKHADTVPSTSLSWFQVLQKYNSCDNVLGSDRKREEVCTNQCQLTYHQFTNV